MRSIVLWLHYVILSFQMDADDDGYDDEFDWDGGCVWNQNITLFPERTPYLYLYSCPKHTFPVLSPFPTQGSLKGCSRVIEGLSKGCPRVAQGLPKGCPKGYPKGCLRVAQGLLKGCSRDLQGLLKGCSWVAQGLHKGCSRGVQGLVKGCARFAQGVPLFYYMSAERLS